MTWFVFVRKLVFFFLLPKNDKFRKEIKKRSISKYYFSILKQVISSQSNLGTGFSISAWKPLQWLLTLIFLRYTSIWI